MSVRTTGPRRIPTWVAAVISGGFGLFFAYAVWNAVAFLVAQSTGPLGLNGAGWALLLFACVFPILVFAAAFALGIRRRPYALALLMLSGLVLVAVFWLNVLAYSLVGGAGLVAG